MTTPTTLLRLVTPGISYLFGIIGWKAQVGDSGGKIEVSLTHPTHPPQSRTFPYPVTNTDLSTPLLEWRDQLQEEYPK